MNDEERREIQERVRIEEAERARLGVAPAAFSACLCFAVFSGMLTYCAGASGCAAEDTVFHGEIVTAFLAFAAALIFVRARR